VGKDWPGNPLFLGEIMISGWRAVLQIDCPGKNECLRYADVPAVDPIHIAIVAEATESAKAIRLYAEAQRVLSSLHSTTMPSYCGPARLLGCMARSEPGCRSVLAVVTGNSRISSNTENLIHQWLTRQNSTVLPIPPAGADLSAILPYPQDRLGALFDPGPIEILVPDILRAAGIGGDRFRLFLSYRRADAKDLADQLFDALAHRGFDVYLDRFRGTPGRSFPREIAEELADKGLVLVIESQHINQSRWTLAEVAFALLFRLGLLAVTMPQGRRFLFIPSANRSIPRPNDWLSGSGQLTDSACESLVDFIRRRYMLQVTYRRIYLETLLTRALAGRSLTSQVHADGVHRVTGSGQDYTIHLSSRPPQLGEARRVALAAVKKAHGIIVGPHGFLRPDHAEDMHWLADKLDMSLRHEGEVRKLAASIAAGKVPP
jgi:TIR domain